MSHGLRLRSPPELRLPEMQSVLAMSDALIDELVGLMRSECAWYTLSHDRLSDHRAA
jgi:hypothetical protein